MAQRIACFKKKNPLDSLFKPHLSTARESSFMLKVQYWLNCDTEGLGSDRAVRSYWEVPELTVVFKPCVLWRPAFVSQEMKVFDLEQKCPKQEKNNLTGGCFGKSVLELNSEQEDTCRQQLKQKVTLHLQTFDKTSYTSLVLG